MEENRRKQQEEEVKKARRKEELERKKAEEEARVLAQMQAEVTTELFSFLSFFCSLLFLITCYGITFHRADGRSASEGRGGSLEAAQAKGGARTQACRGGGQDDRSAPSRGTHIDSRYTIARKHMRIRFDYIVDRCSAACVCA